MKMYKGQQLTVPNARQNDHHKVQEVYDVEKKIVEWLVDGKKHALTQMG
jgi:hypothetical protein